MCELPTKLTKIYLWREVMLCPCEHYFLWSSVETRRAHKMPNHQKVSHNLIRGLLAQICMLGCFVLVVSILQVFALSPACKPNSKRKAEDLKVIWFPQASLICYQLPFVWVLHGHSHYRRRHQIGWEEIALELFFRCLGDFITFCNFFKVFSLPLFLY